MNYLGNFVSGEHIKALVEAGELEFHGVEWEGELCPLDVSMIEDEDIFIGMHNPNVCYENKLTSFWYVFKQTPREIKMAEKRCNLLLKIKG